MPFETRTQHIMPTGMQNRLAALLPSISQASISNWIKKGLYNMIPNDYKITTECYVALTHHIDLTRHSLKGVYGYGGWIQYLLSARFYEFRKDMLAIYHAYQNSSQDETVQVPATTLIKVNKEAPNKREKLPTEVIKKRKAEYMKAYFAKRKAKKEADLKEVEQSYRDNTAVKKNVAQAEKLDNIARDVVDVTTAPIFKEPSERERALTQKLALVNNEVEFLRRVRVFEVVVATILVTWLSILLFLK